MRDVFELICLCETVRACIKSFEEKKIGNVNLSVGVLIIITVYSSSCLRCFSLWERTEHVYFAVSVLHHFAFFGYVY